jgi:hypothetical protein
MAGAGRAPTMQIGQLTGVWAAVYRTRDRLEQHAAEQVLTAWCDVAASLDLTAVMAVLRHLTAPVETDQGTDRQRHIRQVVAAAMLARMVRLTTRPGWPVLIGALTTGMRQARAFGVRAGHAVIVDDADELEDDVGDEDEDLADGEGEDVSAAYTAAAAALRGTAQDISRALIASAEEGDDEQQMQDRADTVIDAGSAWMLAATTIAAAAFMDGMLAAYQDRTVAQVRFVTVADGRVCPTCANAEDGSPYTPAAVPLPPLHPSCRCIVQPTT